MDGADGERVRAGRVAGLQEDRLSPGCLHWPNAESPCSYKPAGDYFSLSYRMFEAHD
jgi:hypothetical protein